MSVDYRRLEEVMQSRPGSVEHEGAAGSHHRGWREGIALFAVIVVLAGIGIAASRATTSTPSKAVAATAADAVTPPRGPRSVVYDRFERGPGSLGKAETGQPWATIGAPWVVDGHAAGLGAAGATGRTVGVIRTDATDGTVQVRMVAVAPGAGLVFRYKDAMDYWSLTSAPVYGTWNLQRVDNGQVTTVGTTGKSGATDGSTIAVRFTGPDLVVLLNGVEVATFQDGTLADQHGVGLIGFADDQRRARWDDFVLTAAPSADAPATTATPGSSG